MANSLIPPVAPPHGLFDNEQRRWLADMFNYARLSDQASDILAPLNSVPEKPVVNKLYWFSGPIAGAGIANEGIYIYKSDGSWYAISDVVVP